MEGSGFHSFPITIKPVLDGLKLNFGVHECGPSVAFPRKSRFPHADNLIPDR